MKTPRLLLAAVAVAAFGLAGCEKHLKAPAEEGVCYFIGHPDDPATGKKTVKFNPIAHDQPDIEHCAAKLYIARLAMLSTHTAGDVTEGSYAGNFLFVYNRSIDFATTYEGPRFPLLVKAPDGRLVSPGSVVEEEDTADTGPHTVDVTQDQMPAKPAGDAKATAVTPPAGKTVDLTQNPNDVPRPKPVR